MNSPINFKFVKNFDISVVTNGEAQTLTVLTLDKKANDEYWKTLHCFSALINELNLSSPEEAKNWTLSFKPFASNLAMIDLTTELLSEILDPPILAEVQNLKDISPILTEIYGVPVEWINSEEPTCNLVLANDEVIENKYWK